MKKLLTLITLTLLANAVSAAVHNIDMKEECQKPLQLAEGQINRITVKDGVVSSIIANPLKFKIKINETLGQAFVTLFHPIEEPEGFTVITDSGFAADFLVTSHSGEPDIVYLQEPEEIDENFFKQSFSLNQLQDLYQGKGVEGFKKRLLHRDESLEVGTLLPFIQAITVYSGEFEDIYLLTLKNTNRRSLPLNLAEFEDTSWIFCPTEELKPREETKIVIAKART